MNAKKLNLDKLESYILKMYGGDINYLATELRKLAIDYGRVNAFIGTNTNDTYISEASHSYMTVLDDIADILDKINREIN